jgi:peptidoglycan hydrolase CwlO-like protein
MARTRAGQMGIDKPQTEKGVAAQGEGEDGARVIKVRMLLGVLVVLVAFTAGCGSATDQSHQKAREKVQAKGQQARQDAEKMVKDKKQAVKKEVEALQKQVGDLKEEVSDLQKKINAHEEKEQQQQINQLKKTLKDLKKRVDAQEQQGQ